MDYLSLSLTMIFVLIALFLSKSFKAGVEKDMVIATIRAAVQLLVIGYVLSLIFRGDHPCFYLVHDTANAGSGGTKCRQTKEKYDRFVLESIRSVSDCRNGNARHFAVSSYHPVYGPICHSDQRNGHWKFDGARKSVFKPA